MAEVALRNVFKSYDNVVAVSNISLDIPNHEFVVLVGPSGCGKSTTLRMIAGLEEISAGEISIDGEVVNDVPPKDRDIAMVFQNYALYPHMTVAENMSFGLKLRKFSKAEIRQRVDNAARILDLEQHLDRKPANLSGGQR
ncbi:MAG: ATP-binding cassette domain-containing protein, partial [Pseudolabrys sp.]